MIFLKSMWSLVGQPWIPHIGLDRLLKRKRGHEVKVKVGGVSGRSEEVNMININTMKFSTNKILH